MARVLVLVVSTVAAFAQDSLPTVSIKLVPPSNGEVESKLASLAKQRAGLEVAQERALQRAYDAALASAQVGVAETMAKYSKAKSVAFLNSTQSKPFSITLAPPSETDVDGSLDAILSSEVAKSESVAADFTTLKAAMLGKAQAEIAHIFDHRARSVAFLSKAGGEFAVRVNLMPVPPTSASVLRKVGAVEAKLAQDEQTLFEQAAREMHGLTSIVLGELERQMRLHARRGAGFLQTEARDLPQVANVAVGAAGPFATIAAQVQGMESKQTVSTIAVLRRILELEQQLLQAENALLQKALAEAVA